MFKLTGGRKAFFAILAVIIPILNALMGEPLDTKALGMAISGLLTFILAEGAKDYKNAKGGNGKATLSGALKKEIEALNAKIDDLSGSSVNVEVGGPIISDKPQAHDNFMGKPIG